MKSRIRKKMMWVQLVILAAVIGGGALIYYLAAPFYHRFQRNQLIWEAYAYLRETDFDMLENSDESVLWHYEEQNLRFTISNGDFQPVYCTWSDNAKHQVERHILKYLNEFSENPELVCSESNRFSDIKLMALLKEDGETYYVNIRLRKDPSWVVYDNMEFVLAAFFFAFLLSLPVLYLLSKRIALSFDEILEGLDRAARKDFQVHLEENGPYDVLNVLAKNVNRITVLLRAYEEKQSQMEKECLDEAGHRQKDMLESIRKDVVADISHELKTPLAIISSQVEMLQCMDERIDRSYYYDSIVEEVTRMSDMVGELMDLSLQEQKYQEMGQCEINLTDVMEYIRLKYQALFRQNHIKGDFSVEQECCAWGNAHYLEQAIDNYIMNAFSHTAQGNCIRVCLYREEGWVWVTVYNQGKKIEPSEMEHIWQGYVLLRSEQEQAEEPLEQKHMGMGLYLVRRIIRLHQGECGVENIDKGVKFWFKIPEGKDQKEKGE